jgi:hypothetical protein
MDIEIKNKIERWKLKAELFLENNIKCFIKSLDGGYYSGDILLVGDNWISIYDFIKKKNFRIFWLDIILFEEYKEKGVGK